MASEAEMNENGDTKGSMWALDQKVDQYMDEEARRLINMYREKEFGCQDDKTFCGIFDGHGPWGHFVAKTVRESLPMSLLCNWQEALAEASLNPNFDFESNKRL